MFFVEITLKNQFQKLNAVQKGCGEPHFYLVREKKESGCLGRRLQMAPFYVYMLLCENKSFYTGYTKSVKSRFRLHVNGKGARYTKMHKPQSLVYVEEFDSRSEAMKREKRIKKLTHAKKIKLAKSYTKNQKHNKKKRKSHDSAQM